MKVDINVEEATRFYFLISHLHIYNFKFLTEIKNFFFNLNSFINFARFTKIPKHN